MEELELGGATDPEGGHPVKFLKGGPPKPDPPRTRAPLYMGKRQYLTITLFIFQIEHT